MNERELDPTALHALIDGELTPEEHAVTIELVNQDPSTGVLYAEYRRLKQALAALPEVQVPEKAWKLCTRRLDEIDKSRKAERFVSRYAWAFSASIFMLILGAGAYNRFTGQHLGAGDVTHMASILSPLERTDNPGNVQVGKWLQDRVGPVELNHPAVIRVLCAESGNVEGTRVARLILQDTRGRMALYVWHGTDPIDGFSPIHGGPFSAGRMVDGNCVAWSQNGCHLILVGPRNIEDLEQTGSALSNGAVSVSG